MKLDMRILLAVAAGGAIGSAARYLVQLAVESRGSAWPMGTLLINIVGSFLLGVVIQSGAGLLAHVPEFRLFMTAGICGGFTTFSTFSYDAARLLREDRYGPAAIYIAASVGLSLLACAAGLAVGSWLFGARAVPVEEPR